ncbi:MAG: hypothetical protein L0Z53_00510 [Acidobacteriales bacterium]|nr:hypothetical protein [Terriglobales bacterium]
MPRHKRKHPRWDAGNRRLLFGPLIVKEFIRPAASQILVLTAFQEQGWPRRIDNPLSGTHKKAHEHLRSVIKKLSHGQQILRFHGDGTGQGLWWEVLV